MVTIQLLVILVVIVAVAVILFFLWLRKRGHYLRPLPPVKVPRNPSPCTPPADRQGDVLKGVYDPNRLQVLADCSMAKGTVAKVTHEVDGDYHIQVNLDSGFEGLLKAGQQLLVVEVIPPDQDKVPIPTVGDHIQIEGSWVFDRIHGHNQIHPAWKIEIG